MMEFEDSIDDEDFDSFDDDYGDGEFEDAEAAPGRQRGPVRRARNQGSYTNGVQGRQYGMVRTPQGSARVELPGKFPTVNEFKQSIAKLQSDIKANSAGIAQLTERLKQDAQGEAKLRTKSDRILLRNLKRTQFAALFALALPVLLEAGRPQNARAFG